MKGRLLSLGNFSSTRLLFVEGRGVNESLKLCGKAWFKESAVMPEDEV